MLIVMVVPKMVKVGMMGLLLLRLLLLLLGNQLLR